MTGLSFPNLGDQTLAFRATAKAEGIDVVLDVVFVAVGHNIVSFTAAGPQPISGADLKGLLAPVCQRWPWPPSPERANTAWALGDAARASARTTRKRTCRAECVTSPRVRHASGRARQRLAHV